MHTCPVTHYLSGVQLNIHCLKIFYLYYLKCVLMLMYLFNNFRLLEIQPKFWSDLNWIEITNKFYPGANSKVINTFFHWWVYNKVPSETRKNVRGNLKQIFKLDVIILRTFFFFFIDTLLFLSKHIMNDETKYIENDDDPEYPRLTVNDDNLLIKL